MVKHPSARRLGVGAPLGATIREAAGARQPGHHSRSAHQSSSGSSSGPSASFAPPGRAVVKAAGSVLIPPVVPPSSSVALVPHAPSPHVVASGGTLTVGGISFRIPQGPRQQSSPSASAGCSRGSLSAAAATAASDESMSEAISALLRDQFATSSLAARNSQLKTWHSMHRMAYCRDSNPPAAFPLTEDKILRISALFKASGYKSFENYMGRAKGEHISLGPLAGGDWTPSLDRAAKDATRSVLRGVGRVRQSTPLDPIPVHRLNVPSTPFSPNGPLSPSDFAIAGTLFLLREIELSAAQVGHVTFPLPEHSAVTWLLPSSKTDPRAVGVSRTLDCMCDISEMGGICPVTILQRQRDVASTLAESLGRDASSFPLFPDAAGNEITKAAAVSTIFELARRAGFRTHASNGSPLYGGHSLRTGGAALFASLGVHPLRIQSLGRWRSPLVLHYAGEAMATNVVRDLRKCGGSPLSSGANSPAMASLLAKLEERLCALEAAPTARALAVAEPVATILHNATGCLHRVFLLESGLSDRTLCNWLFDDSAVSLHTDFDGAFVECPTCFEAVGRNQDSDSS